MTAPIKLRNGLELELLAGDDVSRRSASARVGSPATSESKSKGARAVEYADRVIVESFVTSDGESYIDICMDNVRRTLRISSRETRALLDRLMYEQEQRPLGSQARQDALDVLDARARFGGVVRTVYVRIAEHGGDVWLDLCDERCRAIRVTARGWSVVESTNVPVRFRRSRGMRAIPVPTRGGSLLELRTVVHVDDDAFIMIVAWLLNALRARGPYPLLAIAGEQGSAKSTCSRLLRGLVDPHDVPLRSPPACERDLLVSASATHVVALDNLSYMPGWLSDALCRIATGGGFSARELYTDADECILTATRPAIVTSIEAVVTRADLADRSYSIELQTVRDTQRRTEREIDALFAAAQPRILGALLDAVAHGLAHEGVIRLERLPRMADAARWVVACEPACPCPPGSYLSALAGVRSEAMTAGLTGDDVALAVMAHIDRSGGDWTGTPTELLKALNSCRVETRPPKGWPATPRALSGRLTRAAPVLREGAGIEFDRERSSGGNRTRLLRLRRITRSVDRPERPEQCGLPPDGSKEARDEVGASVWPIVPPIVPTSPIGTRDVRDGRDGPIDADSVRGVDMEGETVPSRAPRQ